MQWGLRDLALPPEQFWRSTLRELVQHQHKPPAVELRQTLDEMSRMFPD
jgi:uncharacterized phage protein (TIGR02216 family)